MSRSSSARRPREFRAPMGSTEDAFPVRNVPADFRIEKQDASQLIPGARNGKRAAANGFTARCCWSGSRLADTSCAAWAGNQGFHVVIEFYEVRSFCAQIRTAPAPSALQPHPVAEGLRGQVKVRAWPMLQRARRRWLPRCAVRWGPTASTRCTSRLGSIRGRRWLPSELEPA